MTEDRRRNPRDLAIGLAAGLAMIFAFAWIERSADRDDAAETIGREKKKYEKIVKTVRDNASVVFAEEGPTEETRRRIGVPAIGMIKEIAVNCGISENLIRVIPEENQKRREMTAKVVLKSVKMNDILNFLVIMRQKYPEVFDREARLRLTGKGEDRWDAGLALTYAQ
jgi:hypothetical protein